MPDRSEDLRREAARCLEAAERSADPNSRDELIRLADKFLELAKSAKADFAPVLGAVTDTMKEASEWALGPFLEEFEVSPAPPATN